MKRGFLVLAAAVIALPVLADNKTPVPSVNSSNLNSSRSNTFRVVGTVTNQSGGTFTVTADGKQVTLSAAKLKDVPRVGETVDVTYTQTRGGPLEATTVKSSKSNTSDRSAADKGTTVDTAKSSTETGSHVSGKVIKTSGGSFTVLSNGKEVTFSGAKLKDLPKVGQIIDITYTQSPGGPLEATTIKSSKSNSSD